MAEVEVVAAGCRAVVEAVAVEVVEVVALDQGITSSPSRYE